MLWAGSREIDLRQVFMLLGLNQESSQIFSMGKSW